MNTARRPDVMHPRHLIRCFILMSLLCWTVSPVSSLIQENTVRYSFVHVSDLQSLTTNYPGTLNLTFSSLESLKNTNNITAIVITGDVVNTWDSERDWNAFSRARNLTTIPVYEIAGNHDTGGGSHYGYYKERTRMPENNTIVPLGDLDFVGINYADGTLAPGEFSRLRKNLTESPRSHAIIATHYYMDDDGTLSPLGNDIDTYLVVKPTLVLMGHMHANFIRERTVGGFPVIADMTNYQDGIPGGKTGWDYSAGTVYTVTSVNGRVETITARVIHIYPDRSAGEEIIVFPPHKDGVISGDSTAADGTRSSSPVVASCSRGDLICHLEQVLRNIRTKYSL